MLVPPLTDEQKRALAVVARMVSKTGAYDYVDQSIEIRLYDEARECFSAALDRTYPTGDK
jgi:hypothetical protein